MSAMKPKGFLPRRTAFSLALAPFAAASPAKAQRAQIALPDIGLPELALPDFNALFNDPLSEPLWLGIGAGLLLLLLLAGFLAWRYLPRGRGKEDEHAKFWKALPAGDDGYKGVLYRNEMLASEDAVTHRITVLLRHERIEHSAILFRNEEAPNVVDMEAVSQAMKLWVNTARDKGLPAVYATRDGAYLLGEGHIAEMEDDPDTFAKKFVSYLMRRKPLPVA